MRTVKKGLSMLIIIMFILIINNFYGLEIKISRDYHFLEIALPVDLLAFDEFRQVDIWVMELTDAKNRVCVSSQTRKFFQGCFWGDNNELWIDGDVGIVMYQHESSVWKEYPVVGVDGENVICYCMDGTKNIDLKLVPKVIAKKLR